MQSEITDDLVQELMAEMDNQPQHIISGSGPAWFFDPTVGSMVRVERGSEIWPIDIGDVDDRGRALVSSAQGLLLVPTPEILELGWN